MAENTAGTSRTEATLDVTGEYCLLGLLPCVIFCRKVTEYLLLFAFFCTSLHTFYLPLSFVFVLCPKRRENCIMGASWLYLCFLELGIRYSHLFSSQKWLKINFCTLFIQKTKKNQKENQILVIFRNFNYLVRNCVLFLFRRKKWKYYAFLSFFFWNFTYFSMFFYLLKIKYPKKKPKSKAIPCVPHD